MRLIQRLQSQNSRTLSEGKTGPLRIEGTAGRTGQRLQRVKTREDRLAKRIVSSGQHAVCLSAAKQFPGMANGIGAGGACVGDDGNGTAESEGLAHIESL